MSTKNKLKKKKMAARAKNKAKRILRKKVAPRRKQVLRRDLPNTRKRLRRKMNIAILDRHSGDLPFKPASLVKPPAIDPATPVPVPAASTAVPIKKMAPTSLRFTDGDKATLERLRVKFGTTGLIDTLRKAMVLAEAA